MPFDNLPLIIEPEELAPLLSSPELILVDLTSPESYAQGHLPKACFVNPKHTQHPQPPVGLLPDQTALETLFGQLGHHSNATYVVYDNEGGGWAGRFIWLLDSIGHSRYHYLNGGLPAWQAAGLPLSQETPTPQPTHPRLQLQQTPTASSDYLLQRLGAADLVIWDARSPAEYTGTKSLAAKAGHIPGAINFEWTQAMDPQRQQRLRTDISDCLEQLGITPDKEVITHCQSHHRSGLTYLIARALGYPRVKAYAGSWSEWGNLSDTPIEQ